MVDCFIAIDNEGIIPRLRMAGVDVNCEFDGFVTAQVPVDLLAQVSQIVGVSDIEVSPKIELCTDSTLNATHTINVLNGQANNLPFNYDGTGVIVGIIDVGFDYQHMAYRCADDPSRCRIVRVYDTSDKTGHKAKYKNSFLPGSVFIDEEILSLTTDNQNDSHGTHTSSIAAGTHVNGYGGMAPGADIVLCAVSEMGTGLSTVEVANCVRYIDSYADSVGKPVVVSNSYGDYVYNRDGSGAQGEVVSQLFGEGHPNRICVFATSNNAGHSGGRPGGVYVSGPASAEKPLGTVICSTDLALNAGWQYYRGEFIADAFTRATDASGIGVRLYVLNAETGAVVDSIVCESTGGNKVLTLSDYFTGNGGAANAKVSVYFDYMTGKGRKQALLYTQYGLKSQEHTLAVEVYPIGGSEDVIDMWSCGTYTFFDAHLTTEGHPWMVGTDDMSVMGNACYPEVISVGSYVSRTCEGSNDVGDISKFSCYALEGMGPLGTMHPWISAPGQDIISAFNHRVNRSSLEDVVVNHPTYLYGLMSGTSMATPMVAGIVALWMQAAAECGKKLTLDEVKTIIKETAIRDEWATIGPNASHFGNGKIDALAGIAYILNEYGGHDYQQGDVNHDGSVNIADVTTLIDYLLNNQTEVCPDCADVNDDAAINIADVTCLIDLLLSAN